MAIKIVEILVAEEDYKYDLSDWDKFSAEKKLEVLRDANSPDESFIWSEKWLHSDEHPEVQDWELHSIVNRSTAVIMEGDPL